MCQECGAQAQKWMGRCADCGAWNSLVEEREAEPAQAAAGQRFAAMAPGGNARLYADIETASAPRLETGIDEFDRVLGGGIVPGSLVLLGGEPGIGKSTLLLQVAARFAEKAGPVLYASGEESEHQVKLRGERLGIGRAPLYLFAETCLERILDEAARLEPALLVVDSIQTVFSQKLQSAPGSISQVREAATQLLFAAKGRGVPTFLVGHVTKDGSLAGPKSLEHIVDTVLYFEGEHHHSHRIVRAVKNRFGEASELGRLRDDQHRAPARRQPLEAVPRRAAGLDARIGGRLLHRGVATDPGRSPGAGQLDQLRHGAADGHRHRPEPAVAPAGGAREAGGPEPGRRGRVRQRRRRDDGGRAGRRPRHRLRRGVERAQPGGRERERRSSARSAWPARCAR